MEATVDSLFFVDTNVLLAATDLSRDLNAPCQERLQTGLKGHCRLFTCGQVLREYLVVATRPLDANGLALTPIQALENVGEFRRCLTPLDETATVSRRLLALVERYSLQGKRIHDANLVAVMMENGLRQLLTDNTDDFQVFSDITIVSP